MKHLLMLVVFVSVVMFVGCNKNEGTKAVDPAKKPSAEGMTVLPSGLKYRVLTAGTGAKPGASERVDVHYRGQFADGKEFDSSYKRGQPATFPVNGVIKGWTEALQLMGAGAKWELCIPPDLAYGKAGMPPVIPPDSTLYFEVELLKVH